MKIVIYQYISYSLLYRYHLKRISIDTHVVGRGSSFGKLK